MSYQYNSRPYFYVNIKFSRFRRDDFISYSDGSTNLQKLTIIIFIVIKNLNIRIYNLHIKIKIYKKLITI